MAATLRRHRGRCDGAGDKNEGDAMVVRILETDCVSASIFSRASVDGDGYTKPLFMMDADEALAFAGDKGVDALLVLEDGTIRVSEGSAFELL